MKLTSYTITFDEFLIDLKKLIATKMQVASEALQEGDFKIVRSLMDDMENLKERIRRTEIRIEKGINLCSDEVSDLHKLICDWCEWEPFAEEIFADHPEVSDILLIEPQNFIIKHWLCNRKLHQDEK